MRAQAWLVAVVLVLLVRRPYFACFGIDAVLTGALW